MTPSPFGLYLREKRIAAKKSLREVAKALGISHVYLGEVERGRRRVLPEHHWDALMRAVPGTTKADLRRLAAQSEALDPVGLEGAGRKVVLALARKLDEEGITEDEAEQFLSLLKRKRRGTR